MYMTTKANSKVGNETGKSITENIENVEDASSNMGKTVGISNATDLNRIVSQGKYNDVIQLAEANYNSQLANIADIIQKKMGKIKIVCRNSL